MSNGNDNEYACACFEHTSTACAHVEVIYAFIHSNLFHYDKGKGGGGGGGEGAIVPAAPMLPTLLVQMAYCHVYECTKCVTGTLENKRVESFWNHYVVEQYKSHVCSITQ